MREVDTSGLLAALIIAQLCRGHVGHTANGHGIISPEVSVVGKADKRTAVLVTPLHLSGITGAIESSKLGSWVVACSLVGFLSPTA